MEPKPPMPAYRRHVLRDFQGIGIGLAVWLGTSLLTVAMATMSRDPSSWDARLLPIPKTLNAIALAITLFYLVALFYHLAVGVRKEAAEAGYSDPDAYMRAVREGRPVPAVRPRPDPASTQPEGLIDSLIFGSRRTYTLTAVLGVTILYKLWRIQHG